jgi:hypothetical protein
LRHKGTWWLYLKSGPPREEARGEPSLEHVERIKAARNLDSMPKKGTKFMSYASFLQFSNEQVANNLSSVGISLGNSVDSVTNALASVRDAEIKRLDTRLNEDKISLVFDREEEEEMEDEEVAKLILNSICSEIMDEVMNLGNAYPLDCKITLRNKSSSSLNRRKKSRSKSKPKGSK